MLVFDGGHYDVAGKPPVIYLGGGGESEAVVTWERDDLYTITVVRGGNRISVEEPCAGPGHAMRRAEQLEHALLC